MHFYKPFPEINHISKQHTFTFLLVITRDNFDVIWCIAVLGSDENYARASSDSASSDSASSDSASSDSASSDSASSDSASSDSAIVPQDLRGSIPLAFLKCSFHQTIYFDIKF